HGNASREVVLMNDLLDVGVVVVADEPDVPRHRIRLEGRVARDGDGVVRYLVEVYLSENDRRALQLDDEMAATVRAVRGARKHQIDPAVRATAHIGDAVKNRPIISEEPKMG